MGSIRRPEYEVDSKKYFIFCLVFVILILFLFDFKWAGILGFCLFLNYFLFKSLFNRMPDTVEKVRFSKYVGTSEYRQIKKVEKNPTPENIQALKEHLRKKQ